jgi:transposase InsO family protein
MSSATFPASREAVLRRIRRSPLKPTGLLSDLGSDYSYTEIQDALSDLLESGDVILTSDLILKPAQISETIKED